MKKHQMRRLLAKRGHPVAGNGGRGTKLLKGAKLAMVVTYLALTRGTIQLHLKLISQFS